MYCPHGASVSGDGDMGRLLITAMQFSKALTRSRPFSLMRMGVRAACGLHTGRLSAPVLLSRFEQLEQVVYGATTKLTPSDIEKL